MIVIPALDVLDGRVVRLAQGDFARVTDYGDDPVAVAQRYEAAGARWLHLVSLDGARDGSGALAALVRGLRAATALSLQAGGGIRDRAALDAVLATGCDRVVLGSIAVREPDAVGAWLAHYGADMITVALDFRIDVEGRPRPATDGWQALGDHDLWHLLEVYAEYGLRHLLCTDISRDGTGTGPNVGLYREILRRYPALALQASGGVADAADLDALRAAGLPAAVCGRALLTGAIDPVAVFA